MSDLFNRAKAVLLANILWVFFFSTNTLAVSYMTATVHLDFFALPANEKINVCIGIYAQWSVVMMALMVTVGKRVKKGEDLLDDDSTAQISTVKKTSTESLSVSTENKP